MNSGKKVRTVYSCNQCGYESSKWLGQCPGCSAWDSLIEQEHSFFSPARKKAAPLEPLTNGALEEEKKRLVSGISELDRVLGGGIVAGSMILIGGDPGIGKSTLILQLLAALCGKEEDVLYVTGEESTRQVRMRAQRLGIATPHILVSTENCVETIIELAQKSKPLLLAVDSIQTMFSEEISSAPGSVTQVRESTARLLRLGKAMGLPVLLVGHVTKEGNIAGPRVLEHMVDTVLYFEGDRGQVFRIIRTVKNRFGSTNEIGVFEMKETGLSEVANPSALFLSERPMNVPGSVVLPSIEGTRPILVEVQALVSRANPGNARRTAIGADPQRLSLLTAVLEKKLGITLFDHDIFLNITGGIRIDEPPLDLGMVAALLSSLFEKIIAPDTVVCGEVGLAGEIRAVSQMDARLREADRLGFAAFIMPRSNFEQMDKKTDRPIRCIPVTSVGQLTDLLFRE